MLANSIIFFHGFDELAAFKRVVGAGLFDINIFSGLTTPDADRRMPVIWRGDGNGVNFFIFEKLANVPISFRSGRAKFSISATRFAETFSSTSQSAAISTPEMCSKPLM